VSLTAGVNIHFYVGTKVNLGGHLIGRILYGGWCGVKAATIASNPETVTPVAPVTDRTYFTLYPNPTNTGNFTLVQKGDKVYGNVRVEVYSMNGDKVSTTTMVGEKKHDFSLSTLPTGLYFVKVVADDYVETIKLVITR
jgi:hypothetical protein